MISEIQLTEPQGKIKNQKLLNDEQIRHFIVNGYVNVTADVPTHIHETIYDRTDSDGRQATARVEGDVLNLYHKRRVEAGFKAYR